MKENMTPTRLEDTSTSPPQNAPCGEAVFLSAPQPDLDRMMEQYGNGLLRLCFMYLKDRQLAEDAAQDTFIKAYKNYAGFDGTNERAWVNRIAVNVCKDMLRSAWNRRVHLTEELPELPTQGDEFAAADTTLVEEVMRLKPKYKEVILLFYYQDMKIADIAHILDAPESTISVRLKRARDILKKRLGGWHYGEE